MLKTDKETVQHVCNFQVKHLIENQLIISVIIIDLELH